MEEVSKCSTPGSVAQKKAYFDACYNRAAAARKAAALIQQEKAAASISVIPKQEVDIDQPQSQCVVEEADSNVDTETLAAFDSTSSVETEQAALREEVAQDPLRKPEPAQELVVEVIYFLFWVL